MSRDEAEMSRSRTPAGGVKALFTRAGSARRQRPEDTAFMRQTTAAALEGPRHFTHWIVWSTLLFFILAFSWAAVAKVDEFTVAQGKVIPSGQVQVIQN